MTLSDKIGLLGGIDANDVKEAIKELKERLNIMNPCYCDDMDENQDMGITKVCDNCCAIYLIDKIMGDRLI
jgi:hypothetical protein